MFSGLTNMYNKAVNHIAEQIQPLADYYEGVHESRARLNRMPVPRNPEVREVIRRDAVEDNERLAAQQRTALLNPPAYLEDRTNDLLEGVGLGEHDPNASNLNNWICAAVGALVGMAGGALAGSLVLGPGGFLTGLAGAAVLGYMGFQYGDDIAAFAEEKFAFNLEHTKTRTAFNVASSGASWLTDTALGFVPGGDYIKDWLSPDGQQETPAARPGDLIPSF